MAPTSPDQLTIVAQAILDTVVTILNTTDAGAPASQFLTGTRPAFDCEFVAVQAARLGEESTSPLSPIMVTGRRDDFGNVILTTWIIYVVRCAPNMIGTKAPTDAAKTAGASIVQHDAWVLWNAIRADQDDLFDGCIGAHFDGGVPIQEEGGYMGWSMQLRAMIEGYVPS